MVLFFLFFEISPVISLPVAGQQVNRRIRAWADSSVFNYG